MGCRGPNDPLELRMIPNRSTGFTPLFLAYRAKAVLPPDLDHGGPRVKALDRDRATEAQKDTVNLLEEAREMTIIPFACYQQTLHRYHERKIRGGSSRSEISCSDEPNQPRRNINSLHNGTYRLKDDNGDILTHRWNIEQLRCFFP